MPIQKNRYHSVSISVNKKNKKIAGDLSITISDNGRGFDNNSIKKFTTLYLADESHKGMGRLSYLRLFNDVNVETTNLDNKGSVQKSVGW